MARDIIAFSEGVKLAHGNRPESVFFHAIADDAEEAKSLEQRFDAALATAEKVRRQYGE